MIALLLGLATGVGIWAFSVGLFLPRPSLASVISRATTQAPIAITSSRTSDHTRFRWLTNPLTRLLRAWGLPGQQLRYDLAIVDRSVVTHLEHKVLLAVAGLLIPGVGQLVLWLLNSALSIEFPIIASLVLGAIGFFAPDIHVRSQAHKRRASFRHALSAFLDLVSISVAGGSGIDTALTRSAEVGTGWAFTRIDHALKSAHLTRTAPWDALQQLGEEIGVVELSEMAASVSLAGTEGSKVRASLVSKAATLRVHQLAEAETSAQAATERMALPVTLLFTGFLLFIGFPALTQVLNGL